jgi:hypothetical protein
VVQECAGFASKLPVQSLVFDAPACGVTQARFFVGPGCVGGPVGFLCGQLPPLAIAADAAAETLRIYSGSHCKTY